MTFSDSARVERPLLEPAGPGELFSLIDSLSYQGGYPFTSDAFYLLTEQVKNNSKLGGGMGEKEACIMEREVCMLEREVCSKEGAGESEKRKVLDPK